MATPTFYHAELDESDREISLSTEEARHAGAARRLQAGSRIQVINGAGMLAEAEIAEISRRNCIVRVLNTRSFPVPTNSLTIATAVPKGDRQRFLVESLTQLGVKAIVPLNCEHSATLASAKNIDKWARYAIEAAKQSENPWVPEIAPACSVSQLLEQLQPEAGLQLWLASASGQAMPERAKATKNLILIGPEAGVSASEREMLLARSFSELSLGPHILRLETAAIAAASVAVHHSG